jgi:pSer/pThr/pTyr-binding forkhead associated (FHA) protein
MDDDDLERATVVAVAATADAAPEGVSRRLQTVRSLLATATPPNATGAHLLVTGDGRMTWHALTGPLTIGRSSSVDLQLDAQNVSGRHCTISMRNDAWLVHDLGSSNGTVVNDRMVEHRALGHGDLICLGSAVIIFLQL